MVLQVQEQSRTNPPIIQNHGWSLITCKTTASSPKAPVLPTVGAPSRKRVGDTQRDCIVFGQTFGGVFYTPCPNERGRICSRPAEGRVTGRPPLPGVQGHRFIGTVYWRQRVLWLLNNFISFIINKCIQRYKYYILMLCLLLYKFIYCINNCWKYTNNYLFNDTNTYYILRIINGLNLDINK